MQDPPHLLIMRLSAMGDVAMLQPVLKAFQTKFPEVQMSLLTQPHFFPIFEDIQFKYRIPFDKNKFRGMVGLWKCYKKLLPLQFDMIIDMHQVLRTQILNSFFKYHRMPVFQIDKGRKEKAALTRKNSKILIPLRSGHERYADALRRAGFDFELSHKLRNRKNNSKKIIGIAPLAAFEQKVWPEKDMSKLMDKIMSDSNYDVLLFGGKQDAEVLEKFIQINPSRIKHTLDLNLKDQMNRMGELKCMISMDSANQHLASIMDVPCLTLWMATHPYAGFQAYGQADEHQLQLMQVDCRPCSVYGNKKCWKERPICKDIKVNQVWMSLQKFLE